MSAHFSSVAAGTTQPFRACRYQVLVWPGRR
jgi:hypothetical protein